MSQQLGVHPQTLRRWERTSKTPKPARTAGNHRLYQQATKGIAQHARVNLPTFSILLIKVEETIYFKSGNIMLCR